MDQVGQVPSFQSWPLTYCELTQLMNPVPLMFKIWLYSCLAQLLQLVYYILQKCIGRLIKIETDWQAQLFELSAMYIMNMFYLQTYTCS